MCLEFGWESIIYSDRDISVILKYIVNLCIEVVVSNISSFLTKKENISSSIFKLCDYFFFLVNYLGGMFRDHIAVTLWKDAQVSAKQLQLVFDIHMTLRDIHLCYCNVIVTLSSAAERINKLQRS